VNYFEVWMIQDRCHHEYYPIQQQLEGLDWSLALTVALFFLVAKYFCHCKHDTFSMLAWMENCWKKTVNWRY